MQRAAWLIAATLAFAVPAAVQAQQSVPGNEAAEARAAFQKLSPADKKKVLELGQQIQKLREQQFQILGLPPPPRRGAGEGGGL